MWATFLSALAGIIVGGAITFFVSRHYFRKASTQLEEESSQLRKLVTVLALYMQKDGLLEDVELDDHGDLRGFTQTIYTPPISSEEEEFGVSAVTQGEPPSEKSSTEKQRKFDDDEDV